MTAPHTAELAAEVASRATDLGWTVGVAESLTSGALASALGAAAQASTWFRGGIVAYASEVKYDVLDVPEGPVVSREQVVSEATDHALGLLRVALEAGSRSRS